MWILNITIFRAFDVPEYTSNNKMANGHTHTHTRHTAALTLRACYSGVGATAREYVCVERPQHSPAGAE
jgi:hypothetical protein